MKRRHYRSFKVRIFRHLSIVIALIVGANLFAVTPSFSAPGITCSAVTSSLGSSFPADNVWKPIRSPNGSVLTDPAGDVTNPNTNIDIYGTDQVGNTPAASAVDWYSTGTSGYFMFRIRVYVTAVAGGRIDAKQWIVGIGTGTTPKAYVVVNGNNSGTNEVTIYNGSGVEKFCYEFNSLGDSSNYAYAFSPDGTKHYVYMQVPYSNLNSVVTLGSGNVYGLFGGTTISNSFSAINRDCLTSNCSVPDFSSTQQTDLSQNLSAATPPPIISSLSVTKGSTSGSTRTVITGTNLTNTARVMFGNSPAIVESSTATTATVRTPSGSLGDVNVQLETVAGGLSNTLQNAYKYISLPTVTTVAATGSTSTTAQLNATINPGNDATTTSFCYRTETGTVNASGALQSCTSVSSTSLSASSSASSISYRATLLASTTYYYQAIAVNSLGTTYGSVLNFTTPAGAVALSITNTSPLTSGQVRVPYNYQFTATGGSGTYSSWTLVSGTLPTGLFLDGSTGVLSGTPTALYETASVVIAVTDTASATSQKTFSISVAAGPPSVSTQDASSVTQTSATLNGNVNDNGANTTVSWCMSSDGAVDTSTGALLSCTQIAVTASPSLVSSGTGFTSITGSATSLVASTTYYFQVKAVGSTTVYGNIKSFTAVNKTNQDTLTLTLSPSSKTYPFTEVMSMSTSGGSGDGTVTYEVVPGGSATGCALSNSSATATLTATSAGTCKIKATKAGDGTYNPASTTASDFTFNKANQSLSFTTTSYSLSYGQSQTVSATGTGTGSITYSIVGASPPCTVSGASVTITTGSGTCTVSATISADQFYNSANSSNNVTITITRSNQATLAAAQVTSTAAYTGSAYTATPSFSTTGGSGTGAVTYSVETGTASTCALSNSSASATLTASSSGTCLIKATKAADDNYNSATSANITFTFTVATQSITFAALSDRVLGSGTFTVSATGGASGNAVTFTSATTDKCTVSTATVTLVATGTCTINANQAGNSNYSAASQVPQSFTITSASVTVSTIDASDIRKNQAKLNGQASEALTNPKFCLKASAFSNKSECATSGTEIEATAVSSGSTVAIEKVATLNPSTTYHYVVYGLSASGGEVTGEVKSFKTKPDVETKAPTSKTARSARLNATVSEALTNPRFCYKTTSFSSLAECLSGGSTGVAEVVSGGTSLVGSTKLAKKASPQISFANLLARKSSTPSGSVVPGTTNYALTVSSLNPNTTYYYIIYGTVDGIEYDGGVKTFATDSEDSGSSGGTSSTPVVTPGPIISSISRSLICVTGTEITISGSYLDGGVVTLNGASAVVKNISGTSIRVSLPSSAAGRKTITVTTPYGSAVAYIDYVSAPKPKYEPIRIPYLAQGDSINLPFAATGALSYSLTGKLPQGLSFNTSTGLISGVASENGIFIFTMVAEGCGETSQLVELDIDAPTPNAISHRINFNRNSCTIPDAAKESLERFLEKAKGLSPRNIIPEIYVSGGGKASDPNGPLADCRQEAICDFLLLENLLGDVLSDVFTGSENRIEIIVYWPRPNDGN